MDRQGRGDGPAAAGLARVRGRRGRSVPIVKLRSDHYFRRVYNAINFDSRDRSAQGIGKALSDGLHIALPSATRDWCAPGVDAAKRNGATPLYIAAQKGHLEILRALMESRAGVAAATDDGATPLYIAEQKEHLEFLRALLESRSGVDAATGNDATPLYIAEQKRHLEVLRTLLESRSGVDAALYIAGQKDHLEVLRPLLESRAGMNADRRNGCTPLHLAAQNGHLEVLRALLESRADVDAAREDLYLTGYMRDDSHCGQC